MEGMQWTLVHKKHHFYFCRWTVTDRAIDIYIFIVPWIVDTVL